MVRGVVFDFDGVLVRTDELHCQAWKRLAEEEGIPFDPTVGARIGGLGRMDSLEVLLECAGGVYSDAQRLALAERKNAAFLDLAKMLTSADAAPGAVLLLDELGRRGIKTAIASSSRNARMMIERVGLAGRFDCVVDGNDVQHTKPHPEVFLLAARQLSLPPGQCVVIEDSPAGIEAAGRAGMRVVGVGSTESLGGADLVVTSLANVTADDLLHLGGS
jgi:beta-phosphoglucomutase